VAKLGQQLKVSPETAMQAMEATQKFGRCHFDDADEGQVRSFAVEQLGAAGENVVALAIDSWRRFRARADAATARAP